MYRKVLHRTIPLIAATSVIALCLVGCTRASSSTSSTSDPGITDTTIDLGTVQPLSGVAAAPAAQALAGLQTWFDAANAAGGIRFGDGKTRTVNVKAYDDAYDPAKSVSAFRQEIAENEFANVGTLGTPDNLAIQPIALTEKMPSILAQAGSDQLSSDQATNPWVMGFLPTQSSEGLAFGKFLASEGKPVTVAVLQENDDVGKNFVSGLQAGIAGSAVQIVASATFEASDPTVDAQMTKLASSNADVFFMGTPLPNIVPQALLKAQQLGWLPGVYLPSAISQPSQSLTPGNASVYPGVYSTVYSKDPTSAEFSSDADVIQFRADLAKYAPADVSSKPVGQAVWGYEIGATLQAAFAKMQQPTRQGLLDAVRQLKGLSLPLLLSGVTLDATSLTESALGSSLKVTKYDFTSQKYVVTD